MWECAGRTTLGRNFSRGSDAVLIGNSAFLALDLGKSYYEWSEKTGSTPKPSNTGKFENVASLRRGSHTENLILQLLPVVFSGGSSTCRSEFSTSYG